MFEVIKDTIRAKYLISLMDKHKPIMADIETDGLYTYTRTLQLYQPQSNDKVIILDFDSVCLDSIKEELKDKWMVWYNASYDLGTLNWQSDKTDDMFYATKLGYPQFMEFSLDKVTHKLFSLGKMPNLYAGMDKKGMQNKGFVKGAYLSRVQLKYAAADVVALYHIFNDKVIQQALTSMAYRVDMLSLKYCIEYQQNGMKVDNEGRLELLKGVKIDIEKYTALLPEGLNPNSYIQVRKLLGIEESDKTAMTRYAVGDMKGLMPPVTAEYIMKLKSAKKQKGYLESINFPKMITKFNPAGAITGRFTAKGGDLPNGFNAQQIPKAFQKLFQHDIGDTTIITLDYAQLELRLAASIYADPVMYKQFMDGEDLHSTMAAMITGKKIHPDGPQGDEYASYDDSRSDRGEYVTHADRGNAKAANFGYIFGMSAGTYVNYAFASYGMKVSLKEAEKIRKAYFTLYPTIAKYHAKVWNNYKKPGFYFHTALGRRVKPKMGTDAINGPVQGTGIECTKLAVHYLLKEYPEAVKYIENVVHDAIYMRVDKKDKDLWLERLRFSMVKSWEEICKMDIMHYKDIPMPI